LKFYVIVELLFTCSLFRQALSRGFTALLGVSSSQAMGTYVL
jgi:hypothetical protein